MTEPTYVSVLRGEIRPLWSTEDDSIFECRARAIKQGLGPDDFDVVSTEDLDTE